MFIANDPSATVNSTAGAISDEKLNGYQVTGAVCVVAVCGGATLGAALVAPLPTIGGLAVGGGLIYAGSRAGQDDKKSAKKDSKKAGKKAKKISKSDKTEAPVTDESVIVTA